MTVTNDRRRSPARNDTDLRGWIVAFIAAAGLIISVFSLSHKVDLATFKIQAVQSSRYSAALDSCYVIRHLVFVAFRPRYSKLAEKTLDQSGLGNCVYYATNVVYAPGVK